MIKRLCGFEKVGTIEEIAKNGYVITLESYIGLKLYLDDR